MEITVTCDTRATHALLSRASAQIDFVLRGTLEDSSSYFLATMKHYPAQRTGSTYKRTGTLGRSWSARPVTKVANGWQTVVGSNGNIAPYNRRVQDRDRQARIHRGRWQTAQGAAEASQARIQGFLSGRLQMALAQLGA